MEGVDVVYQVSLGLGTILAWGAGAAAIVGSLITYIYVKDWSKQDIINTTFAELHKQATEMIGRLDKNLAVLSEIVSHKLDRTI
jgi:hypothetical protein